MKTFYKSIYAIIFCLLFSTLNAQNFQWANKGEAIQGHPSIAVDATGNSYVCGTFSDTCTFGSFSIISVGSSDIYLCKYNSSGVVQWLQDVGGINGETCNDACTDASGNLYITGRLTGQSNFGGIAISGAGAFVAKYAPTGSVIWAKKIDSTQTTVGNMILEGDSGSLFVAGWFYSQTNFGCSVLNFNGTENNFIARLDTSGSCQWVESFPALPNAMALDKNNNVYITGALYDSAKFGATTLYSVGGSQDFFLTKCNFNGSWGWALSAGASSYDSGQGIDVDQFGHVYVTGSFRLSVPFGCATLTSTGVSDIFLACYDTSGNCNWLQQAGGGFGNQYSFRLSTDNYGNCTITGSIIDTTYFGNFTVIPPGENMFAAKYDSTGSCTWAVECMGPFGGAGERGLDIGTDSIGNVYVTGEFYSQGIHIFGSFPLTNNYYINFSKNDIFVTKINTSSTGITLFTNNEEFFSVYPNPTNSILNLPIKNREQINITNTLGEIVLQKEVKGEVELDVSFLSSGIYFIKVGNEVRKFVKE